MLRFLFFLLAPLPILAQFTYTLDTSIPVEVNGKTLLNPWAGGLNSSQINSMDLNGDSHDDLVIFDKTASRISTFIARNKAYEYAPEYEVLFPEGLNTFFLLRDYNCDGKKDIFTFGQIGIYVFLNVTQPGKSLSWKKLSFYNKDSGLKSEVLLTRGFVSHNITNLLPGVNDLPNITDVDGDGDLDIINMRFVSPSTAQYHKNFSVERNNGKCDSLDFEQQTDNWGGFLECSCGKIAFNGQTCAQIGGRTQHTGGKALLTLDMDNDGDQELIFSEEACSRLYYMENQGSPTTALLNSFSLFPAAIPVGIKLFPAAYLEDVDFDGLADLISSPNLYSREDYTTNFMKSVWLYKNTGTKQLPVFTYLKNEFLQEDMIDVGDYASPAFTDIDNDGDKDLFVGTNAGAGEKSSVTYYENTGTSLSPSFKFITDDYVGISYLNLFNIKPQFADIDHNGGADLVFTAVDIQGRSNLYYVLSTSTTSSSFGGQEALTFNIRIFNYENTTMADIDLDGNLDLLIGRSNGALEYWRNTGSENFTLANASFMGLGSSTTRQYLTAVTGDVDGNGEEDLVVGNQAGQISVFDNFRSGGANPQPVTELIYDSFSKSYVSRNLGGRIRPAIANLNGTNKPEIVLGNTQGGLQVLKNESGQVLSDKPVITLFPNPLPQGQSLSIKADRGVIIDIYTTLGQHIGISLTIPANQIISYPLQGIAPGIYIARFTYGEKTIGQRFIIQ